MSNVKYSTIAGTTGRTPSILGTRKGLAHPHRLAKHGGLALVGLMVFVAIAMTITGAAVTVTLINSQTTSKYSLGEEALAIAEAGAENAIMRVLRDPGNSYLGENNLPVGSGTADIVVSRTTSITITSTGKVAGFIRKIQVNASWSNNTLTISSWQQID